MANIIVDLFVLITQCAILSFLVLIWLGRRSVRVNAGGAIERQTPKLQTPEQLIRVNAPKGSPDVWK
jgi:hypothetical protein